MKEQIKKVIEDNKLIEKGSRVGVAVSGGVDSVCLFYVLNLLKQELNIKTIYLLHINHNIRGIESDQDEQFVVNYAKELNCDCWVKSVDAVGYSKNNGYTLEQGARKLRYLAFEEAKEQLNLDTIFLAHHLGDQAETLLMHAFRGCGVQGLVGMGYKSGFYVRPMLDIARKTIENYAKVNGLSWRTDKTNEDCNYSRNLIRNVVIKEAERSYSSLQENLNKLSKKAMEVVDFIDSLLPSDCIQIKGNEVIIYDNILSLHNVLKQRIIQNALVKLNANIDIEDVHYNFILKLFNQTVGKKLYLPGGLMAYKDYGGVILAKPSEILFSTRQFSGQDEFLSPLGIICIKPAKGFIYKSNDLFMNINKIPSNAEWRTIKRGDKFTKFSGGTKSVVDFLTDRKISAFTRKKMVVLATGSEVLCIPGVEISKFVKVDSNQTKGVVAVCLKN